MPEVCKFIAGNVIYKIRCRQNGNQRRRRFRRQWRRQRRLASCFAFALFSFIFLSFLSFILVLSFKLFWSDECWGWPANHTKKKGKSEKRALKLKEEMENQKTKDRRVEGRGGDKAEGRRRLTALLHYTNNQCNACAGQQEIEREWEAAPF